MKVLLLITTCLLNRARIFNQIKNLERNKQELARNNIHPVFVTSDKDLIIDGYETLRLSNFEEKYTNLARKIVYSYEALCRSWEFDHIIKIDDDTFLNLERLDDLVFKYDYVGKFFSQFTQNEIVIKLPSYNIEETVPIYPKAFLTNPFSFAAGSCYFLSRKAVETVALNVPLLEEFYKENVRISEDQFVGYCLQSEEITKYNYEYETLETRDFVLQLTENLTSLHPVSNAIFKELIGLNPEEQLQTLLKSSSLVRRKVLLETLKNNLKSVIFDFVNSKKLSGMG